MTDDRYGKIPTTPVRRLKPSSHVPIRESSGVVEHGSVDRVGEVALADAHGLRRVWPWARAWSCIRRAWFESESDHRRAIDRGVEASVASACEAMSDERLSPSHLIPVSLGTGPLAQPRRGTRGSRT
jgi:hypothetical protein